MIVDNQCEIVFMQIVLQLKFFWNSFFFLINERLP